MKRALITGINGMDGSHMADLLLSKGYEVYGMGRRVSSRHTTNVVHLTNSPRFHTLQGDLTDENSLARCIRASSPHEVYNFAAQSFVGESWNTPEHTSNVTGLGVLRILEALREYGHPVRFYQASSSEMFGGLTDDAANENSSFHPRSPYGVAKLFGHWITKNYRESYGMYNVSGILFNHESERRGLEFVTRKITDGVARIRLGLADSIALGNLDAQRDWGYAPDYMEAIWLMLQQDVPDDYVIATGRTRSIRDFLFAAFSTIGIYDWTSYVTTDPKFFRPAEVHVLRGDSRKAQKTLGWTPTTPFNEWVQRMVKSDINRLKNEVHDG